MTVVTQQPVVTQVTFGENPVTYVDSDGNQVSCSHSELWLGARGERGKLINSCCVRFNGVQHHGHGCRHNL